MSLIVTVNVSLPSVSVDVTVIGSLIPSSGLSIFEASISLVGVFPKLLPASS